MKPGALASIFLCLFVSDSLCGQYVPMAEEGKFWIYLNYYDSEDPNSSVSGHAITFDGDTMINSINYKKVYRHQLKGHHNCPFPPCWQFDYPYQSESKHLIAFIREDTLSKKIYNLPVSPTGFCDTTEHLIFDFSLVVGDTVNSCIYDFIGAGNDPATEGIVDSINSIEWFGKIRNALFTTGTIIYLGDPPVWRISILEGVGLDNYGIFHEPLSLFVDFCEEPGMFCQLLLSTTPIENEKEVNIFPNPTNGLLQVSIEEEEVISIRIYNMMGIFITELINSTYVDISNLEGGIYLLELISESGERMVQKIIKEN